MSTDPAPAPAPTVAEVRDGVTTCLHVKRVVDEVVSAAPYRDLATLLDAIRTSATPLSASEIAEALADHPRIGEKPTGTGASAELSRREQSASASTDETLAAALAEGNAAYEARFGRVFLIRAAGRSRQEILAELHRRIVLDDEEELLNTGGELVQIALLRAEAIFADAFGRRDTAGSPSASGTPTAADSSALAADLTEGTNR